MFDLLLALLLGLVVLRLVCLALKWAFKAEQRVNDRHLMKRVYYPRRGRNAGASALKRWRRPDDVDDW